MNSFYTHVANIGNTIYVRGFDENGERVHRKYPYNPTLYIPSKDDHGFKDVHGNSVKPVHFDSIRDAKDFIKKYEDVDGMTIYGYDRWAYTFIYEHYRDMKPNTKKINTVYLDIEVASDNGFPEPDKAEMPVTAITLKRRNLTVVIGCGEFTSPDKNTFYIKCSDERHLLLKFLQTWENMDVDVLSGWNTEFFDIPYLVNRITKLHSEDTVKRLSPWGRIREYNVYTGAREQQAFEIFGVSHLDYFNVYKKFCLAPRESYRLDFICQTELGEQKLDYSEHGNLHTLYKEDYQKFIEYNIRDVDLVQKLEERLGYIDVIFALTHDSGCNFQDGLSTLTIWDTIIHNYLMNQNIVIPTRKPKSLGHGQIAGGFVKDPHVGMHEWVMSFDLNSLYPHLIMQYSIGPDTHVSKNDLFNRYELLKNSI